MPIRQHAHFALFSRRTTASAMAERLGLGPDRSTVRGSRLSRPIVPVEHSWEISCRESDLRVDDQIACVLARLRPVAGELADLARELRDETPAGGAILIVVRYFTDEPSPGPATDAPNPFGRRLDRDVLDFLHRTGASLGVDEYDLTED
ncbi:DUF4279 domain-containing protein [Actinocorallia aurea]